MLNTTDHPMGSCSMLPKEEQTRLDLGTVLQEGHEEWEYDRGENLEVTCLTNATR
jgi:hypothetical protein